ncbi:hypothetical protein HXX76_011505 [Chlamydomonas incerta]|uniref:Methyltransferase type 11 domain-containing protein n=1 Tax=Chlamydomonas incerta TaxID=51695 RepID=A0A835SXV9_CHLIN|nr:hypothetical protein HXX76_011505 [Chlamydomonas incerta]|eukprot:KAG2428805.1 hypothetical protein HXX76_011505 [Chlamydomonas incerta]
MALDGYSVTNVDISPVVIERMKLQHSQLPTLEYLVADCRDMSGLPGGGFGSCIDKGTLDAVLCGASGQLDAAKYMQEICRLLRPGGVFLLISLGAPSSRLSLLQKLGLWEDVQVLLLPKPLLYLQSDAAMSGRPPPAASAPSKDAPVEALGPWPAAAALAELAARRDSGALDERDYFFAYVSTAAAASSGGCQGAVLSEVGPPRLDPEPVLVGGEAGSCAAAAASQSGPLSVAPLPLPAGAHAPGQKTGDDTVQVQAGAAIDVRPAGEADESGDERGAATQVMQPQHDSGIQIQGLSLAS